VVADGADGEADEALPDADAVIVPYPLPAPVPVAVFVGVGVTPSGLESVIGETVDPLGVLPCTDTTGTVLVPVQVPTMYLRQQTSEYTAAPGMQSAAET
jgi:hypothetical protein